MPSGTGTHSTFGLVPSNTWPQSGALWAILPGVPFLLVPVQVICLASVTCRDTALAQRIQMNKAEWSACANRRFEDAPKRLNNLAAVLRLISLSCGRLTSFHGSHRVVTAAHPADITRIHVVDSAPWRPIVSRAVDASSGMISGSNPLSSAWMT